MTRATSLPRCCRPANGLLRAAVLLALILALPAMAASVSGKPLSFQEGFDAYAAGDYDAAARCFREASAREPSAGACHNLGNAEWKRGQVGEAVLAWEKAQWLNPYGANTRANLRFARYKAQLPSPSLAWYEICSTWLPVGVWASLACASVWLALALVLLPPILRWRKADWHHALAAASLAVFLLTLPALVGIHTRSNLGVVRVREAQLRLTPTRDAQVLGRLPAGELARVEGERGHYYYIRTGSDAAGWVDRAQFGLITGLL